MTSGAAAAAGARAINSAALRIDRGAGGFRIVQGEFVARGASIDRRQEWANRAGAWLGLGAGVILASLVARTARWDPLPAMALLGWLGAGIGALAGRWVGNPINPDELHPDDLERPFVGMHAPDDDLTAARPRRPDVSNI